MMEVAKNSGGRYPPKTVYGTICALKHYLEEKNGSEALNPLVASDKRYLTTFRPRCCYVAVLLLSVMTEGANILYLVSRLIKIQVSRMYLDRMFIGYQNTCT